MFDLPFASEANAMPFGPAIVLFPLVIGAAIVAAGYIMKRARNHHLPSQDQ